MPNKGFKNSLCPVQSTKVIGELVVDFMPEENNPIMQLDKDGNLNSGSTCLSFWDISIELKIKVFFYESDTEKLKTVSDLQEHVENWFINEKIKQMKITEFYTKN